MTTTVDRPRNMPELEKIAAYWIDAAPAVFPDLRAHIIGWGEPMCFRCGWLAPIPETTPYEPWQVTTGWLERAHLQDHALDGPDTPENLIPLCPLCHTVMPTFPDRETAIEWVKRGQPQTCMWWWQWATDAQYGGEQFTAYPGFRAFRRFHLHISDAYRQFEAGALESTNSGLAPAYAGPDAAGAGLAPSGQAAGMGHPRALPAATQAQP